MISTHRVDIPSHSMFYMLRSRNRQFRYWLNNYGSLCGIWQGRNGHTYAVGHDPCGNTIVFRTQDTKWACDERDPR